MKFTATVAKQYNFDAGKVFGTSVIARTLLPTGTQLQRLHSTGLARNFFIWGRLTTKEYVRICFTRNGSIPGKDYMELGKYLQSSDNWRNVEIPSQLGFSTDQYDD